MSRRDTYVSREWTDFCAFWGMVVAGFSHVFGALFKFLVKKVLSGELASLFTRLADVLTLLGNIALLVAIALPAWKYVRTSSKGWKIFYWISLVLFVLGVVFGFALSF